eukprot:7199026-Pyramimonas_sp.AAC.1
MAASCLLGPSPAASRATVGLSSLRTAPCWRSRRRGPMAAQPLRATATGLASGTCAPSPSGTTRRLEGQRLLGDSRHYVHQRDGRLASAGTTCDSLSAAAVQAAWLDAASASH